MRRQGRGTLGGARGGAAWEKTKKAFLTETFGSCVFPDVSLILARDPTWGGMRGCGDVAAAARARARRGGGVGREGAR